MTHQSAKEISNWFLAWAEYKEIKITRLSLQKLLYFSQAHYLADMGVPLFEEEIYAYPKGPFVRDLPYTKTSDLNSDKNDYTVNLTEDFDFDKFPAEISRFLVVIWNTYASLSPFHLVNKTHKELTWVWNFSEEDWPKANIIPKSLMKNYYQLREIAA